MWYHITHIGDSAAHRAMGREAPGMADGGEHKNHRKRMKEKYYSFGADIFTDHELIEMLLFNYVPRVNTNPTAHALLDRAGSLYSLLNMTSEELSMTGRVTKKAAMYIPLLMPAVSEAIRRSGRRHPSGEDSAARKHTVFSDLISHAKELGVGEMCVYACKSDSDMSGGLDFPTGGLDFRKAAELAFFFGTRRLSFAERADRLFSDNFKLCSSVLECADIDISHYLVLYGDSCYDLAKGRYIDI